MKDTAMKHGPLMRQIHFDVLFTYQKHVIILLFLFIIFRGKPRNDHEDTMRYRGCAIRCRGNIIETYNMPEPGEAAEVVRSDPKPTERK